MTQGGELVLSECPTGTFRVKLFDNYEEVSVWEDEETQIVYRGANHLADDESFEKLEFPDGCDHLELV